VGKGKGWIQGASAPDPILSLRTVTTLAENNPRLAHTDRDKNLSTNRASQSFWRIAENFPAWMHTDKWRSYGPRESKCLESSRNSLSWTILQGTSLLSGFYSATMPVTSRKQGICLQNRGGGTRSSKVRPCLPLVRHAGRRTLAKSLQQNQG